MKTLKLFVSLLVVAFIAISTSVNAQTIQQKLYAEYDNLFTPCINLNLSGSYVLNCTFHLDKKTGKMDRLHINMMQSDCWVTETGERVTILESTNDKLGLYWDVMNNINYYNGDPDMYNVEDGWLDTYIPDVLPSEGVMIDMNWRFIMKGGGNFVLATMIMTHLNARGELVVDKVISRADCNE
jgi:hypothetical protein